jgi:hypothetical protein
MYFLRFYIGDWHMTSCSLLVGKQISWHYYAEESNIKVTGIQRERIRNILVSKKYDILEKKSTNYSSKIIIGGSMYSKEPDNYHQT